MPKKKAKKRKVKSVRHLDANQMAAKLVEQTIKFSEQGAVGTGNK